MPSSHPFTIGAIALAVLVAPLSAQAPADVRYGRDVRPILADRCFRCHGPDAGTREAKLRLDDRDDAVRAREHGAAIVPGEPAKSLLWQRITAHDDDRMPPADSGKAALDAHQIAIVEAWIAAGALYEGHWSFVPPTAPELPPATDNNHPVDRFLDRARAARGLQRAPAADATTLVRRVFLALTGLPPTPAEVEAFVADRAPGAYERLVDRLLETEPYRTRHAEHLAQVWLDAGRYADTSGIHMDAGRQAWAWRDWLIAALRDDMPFDQFVLEQLAGDLLPNATNQQRVATGFLRNHVTTDEGGAIDEEYRVEYAAERTATVGGVFLGLTFQCARCHDHKYDPIRQEDYYRLFSFFNSNREPGLYSQLPDANRALEPFMQVPTAEQEQHRQRLRDELATAEHVLREVSPEEKAIFEAFRHDFVARAGATWCAPTALTATSLGGATLQVEADGIVMASGANPAQDTHVVTMTTTLANLRWLSLEAMPHASLGESKVGRSPNGNAVLQHVELATRAAGSQGDWQVVPLVYALANVEQDDGDFAVSNVLDDDRDGWAVAAHKAAARSARALLLTADPLGDGGELELRVTLKYDSQYANHTFGRVRFRVGSCRPELLAELPLSTSRFHVAGPFPEAGGDLYATNHGPESVSRIDGRQRWGKLAWRFDGRLKEGQAFDTLPKGRNATYVAQQVYSPTARRVQIKLGSDDGFQLFVNGRMVAERRVDRAVGVDQDEASIDLPAGASAVVLKIVNTGGNGGFALRHLPHATELAGDLGLLALPDAEADVDVQQRTAEAFRMLRSPHHLERRATVERLQQESKALEDAIPRAMVMEEAKEMRATFVLTRGEYDKPDPQRPVARELPSMFGALAADQPKNRLGLARWLVSAQNPLLLRVQANRLWEFVFGTGIVRTSEDFGLQGEWPSNPALLDWLALELRRNGHSTRAMIRLLVTSAAFKQRARVDDKAAAIDRDNRMLTWFPRRRLTAEALRDQALFVGGLLVERVGGPSVKPYQPQGLWQEVAMTQSNTRIYTQGSGNDLWRRSLYTYWKRACPPPNLQTLDAPTREFCTVRRGTTNTPLQALVLWNDEQFFEAARGLAQRTLLEARDDSQRLAAMYTRCTGRQLTGASLDEAAATLRSLLRRFHATPADAEALLGVGQLPRPADLSVPELAAFTVLANAFLNLDATLCID